MRNVILNSRSMTRSFSRCAGFAALTATILCLLLCLPGTSEAQTRRASVSPGSGPAPANPWFFQTYPTWYGAVSNATAYAFEDSVVIRTGEPTRPWMVAFPYSRQLIHPPAGATASQIINGQSDPTFTFTVTDDFESAATEYRVVSGNDHPQILSTGTGRFIVLSIKPR